MNVKRIIAICAAVCLCNMAYALMFSVGGVVVGDGFYRNIDITTGNSVVFPSRRKSLV